MTKRWTQEEESLLIELKDDLGYTYKEISIEIGRSAGSCKVKYNKLINPKYLENQRKNSRQYREDNKDNILEYLKKYREDNKEKLSEYFKQYYKDNKDKIAQYRRNYDAKNPNKSIRKERYNGEFKDIKLCYEFYNGISPITGTKDDLQVHHLISVKNNKEFWESATPEIKINYLILVPKDIHAAYHSWMGGTKVPSTPESFWFFIDNVFFNDQATLDSFVL